MNNNVNNEAHMEQNYATSNMHIKEFVKNHVLEIIRTNKDDLRSLYLEYPMFFKKELELRAKLDWVHNNHDIKAMRQLEGRLNYLVNIAINYGYEKRTIPELLTDRRLSSLDYLVFEEVLAEVLSELEYEQLFQPAYPLFSGVGANYKIHMEKYNYIEEITAQYKNDPTNYAIINYAKNEVEAGRLTIEQVKVWVRDNQELLNKALETIRKLRQSIYFTKEDKENLPKTKTTLQKDAAIRWYILTKDLCIKELDYKQMVQDAVHEDMKHTDLYQRYIDTKDPQAYTELKERIRRMKIEASSFPYEAEINIIRNPTNGGLWKTNPMMWEQLILQYLMIDYVKELQKQNSENK